MTNFSYNRDIPNGPDNPSQDAPKMKVNTNNTDSLLAVNHNSFGVNDGGKHKFIQMPLDLNPGGSTAAKEILLYNGFDAFYNLYFVPPSKLISTGQVQMTRNETPDAASTGFSWLPGGIFIQWGTATQATDGGTPFPQPFAALPYNVQVTVFENNNSRHDVFVKATSTTGFTVASRNSSGADETNTFFWMAIGK